MSDGAILTVVISAGIWITLGGLLGAYVAGEKRRSDVEGLVLGVIFGLFGVLIEALLPNGHD